MVFPTQTIAYDSERAENKMEAFFLAQLLGCVFLFLRAGDIPPVPKSTLTNIDSLYIFYTYF